MKNWEKALNIFLEKYKNKTFFEGALLCGSYSSGNQNAFSDIDVNILISDSQDWCEHGSVNINGFLIEYFISPIKKVLQEFQDNTKDGYASCATLFAYGKIIIDKNGYVKKLQKTAQNALKQPMPKHKKSDLALDFHTAWNSMDELHSLAKDKKSLGLIYNYLLENLMTLYFEAKQIPKLPLAKIEKVFSDPGYAKRYHADKLPNKKFRSLFLTALQNQNIENIQKLYDYVLDKSGGFDINHFKLHSKLSKKQLLVKKN